MSEQALSQPLRFASRHAGCGALRALLGRWSCALRAPSSGLSSRGRLRSSVASALLLLALAAGCGFGGDPPPPKEDPRVQADAAPAPAKFAALADAGLAR